MRVMLRVMLRKGKKKLVKKIFTIIMSDKEPSALPIPLVSESAGELEREPLHPRR